MVAAELKTLSKRKQLIVQPHSLENKEIYFRVTMAELTDCT